MLVHRGAQTGEAGEGEEQNGKVDQATTSFSAARRPLALMAGR